LAVFAWPEPPSGIPGEPSAGVITETELASVHHNRTSVPLVGRAMFFYRLPTQLLLLADQQKKRSDSYQQSHRNTDDQRNNSVPTFDR
jgi:hypothetical protein